MTSLPKFQFHKGTIRTDYFNGVLPTPQLFQFHKGTIRTLIHLALKTLIPLFQFHKGTIRTTERVYTPRGLPNFNSIKVQLERFVAS